MAGRILPVALAAMVGVSIGVATFDGEFKKQKMARLEEEYRRELAAAAASSTANPALVAVSAVAPPAPEQEQVQAKKAEAVASAPADNSWSNTLGFWAWKKEVKDPASAVKSTQEAKGKP